MLALADCGEMGLVEMSKSVGAIWNYAGRPIAKMAGGPTGEREVQIVYQCIVHVLGVVGD